MKNAAAASCPGLSTNLDNLRFEPSAGQLRQVEAAYEAGRMLEAWAAAQAIGPLARWAGPEARILAGRLAGNLGGQRLAQIFFWRAWRAHPGHPGAAAYRAQSILERLGPWRALEFLERVPEPGEETSAEIQIYLLTLRAMAYSAYRDFETASGYLDHARAIQPDNRWLAVVESGCLEKQDRYDEALAAARRSLVAQSYYRPGVQVIAHLYQVLDRDAEALGLLRQACAHTECGQIAAQLAGLEIDLGLYAEAETHLAQFENLSPLADRTVRQWLRLRRMDVACRTGDVARARVLVTEKPAPFPPGLEARLAEVEPPRRRVRLEVDFVRQHYLTCAPATLTALCRYWQQPAEHLELAEAICYDGTPCHSERTWAETHGFTVREFTVTWAVAVELIDRGLPFTLTTAEATSSHLQAVIGYEELRQALLLRDPYYYYTAEAFCPQFLERYAATGPRGMVPVPHAERGRLAGLELPDASLYDQLHALNCALNEHRREAAAAILRALEAAAPDHRLVLTAGRCLAAYDANTAVLPRYIDRLLARFPRDAHLNLAKWGCLAEHAARAERLEFLEGVCRQPNADPVFYVKLAGELGQDARTEAAAFAAVREARRRRPVDAEVLLACAAWHWRARDQEKAFRLYRLAACLGSRQEAFARAYFGAARNLRQTGVGLDFLRRRCAELGRQSPQPAMTLFEVLAQLDRVEEAFSVLQQAAQLKPDDGELLLFVADAQARFANYEEARRFLALAEGKQRRNAWLRSAAALAAYRCDRKEALALWREVIDLEPLALDASRAAAQLLEETEGGPAAADFLDRVCARFPCHCGMLGLRAAYFQETGAPGTEAALRALLAVNPAHAWAHRELAMLLDGVGRADEAWDHARQGLELEPGSPFTHNVCGALHEAHGRRDPARDAWRRAIELAVDTAYAIEKLTNTGETDAQRGEALAFIEGELRRQVVFGDGLFAYRRAARGILPPAAVWDRLQEALRARPDLWAAWSVTIQQAIDMDRLDEAAALAAAAGERFPYVAQLWRDRARLHQARLEAPEAIRALEAALLLQPAWSEAARELGELLERHHDLTRAQKVIELACAQAPMDGVNHGCLASVLWRAGRREEAITRLRHALRLQPGYVWAWSTLREWAQAEGQPELTLSLARDLAERRPGEARSWMVLAEQLGERLDPECLEAAARALALNPRGDQVYELQARLLVKLNRCEEALACCRPAILSPTPVRLRMCEAWIEAERGRLPTAIAAMEATLREAPANYEGWERLTQWLSQAGEPARAAEAADHLAALAPHDPKPLAYAAFLRRQQGDSEGAIERYRRAFQLDPSYEFAGLSLADLLLERQELAEAGDVLATLRHTEAGAAVQLRCLQLALAASNSTRALEIFEALCREPNGEAGCLFAANDALVQNGRDKAVRATIQRLLGEAQTSAWLGALWVKRRFFRGQYSINRVFQQLTGPGERGRNTLITYLNSLAGCYHAAAARREIIGPWRMRRCLRALLATRRERLLEDDELWGATGYSLATLGLYAQTVAWLETWPQRAKAQPWMLYNFALASIVLKRPEPALAALRRGLEMRQDAELYGSLAVAAAFEEAMAGRGAAARELLASQEGRKLAAADFAMAGLTRVLLAGAEDTPVGAYRRAVQVREMVRDSFSGFRPCHHGALVRRCYRRCLRQASQHSGGWMVKAWGSWHYLGGAGWFMAAVLVVSSPFLLCLPPVGWFVIAWIWSHLQAPD